MDVPPLNHTVAVGVLHQRAEAGPAVEAARQAEVSPCPGTVQTARTQARSWRERGRNTAHTRSLLQAKMKLLAVSSQFFNQEDQKDLIK